jgi:segregation and condensation protein A
MSTAPASTEPSAPPAHLPQQQEMPLAVVLGQPWLKMPEDLYIPPDALEVILEAFEGPLDLLLYLIRRQNLDILDIPVAEITRQYTDYIELMHELKLELAAEYLVMAAILAEIKSRLLLPRPASEDDPRAELVRRLQEYERFQKAAADLDALPRQERDFMPVRIDAGDRKVVRMPPPVDLRELLLALKDVLRRADLLTRHEIQRDALSVRQRMADVLSRLRGEAFHPFESLFDPAEGRRGIVVTFIALLELAKEHLIEIVQERSLGPIYLRGAGATDDATDPAGGDSDRPGPTEPDTDGPWIQSA